MNECDEWKYEVQNFIESKLRIWLEQCGLFLWKIAPTMTESLEEVVMSLTLISEGPPNL